MTDDASDLTASLVDMTIRFFADTNFTPAYTEALRIIREHHWPSPDEPAALAAVALHVLQQPGTRTKFLHQLAARDSETLDKLRAVWVCPLVDRLAGQYDQMTVRLCHRYRAIASLPLRIKAHRQ